MIDEVFSDGIGEIAVNGPIVRIDLVSLSPSERDAAGKARTVLRQRVVMTVEAFANSADLVQKVMQSLIDGGSIQRTQGPVGASPPRPAAATGNGAAQRANVSPNFS